MRREWNTAIGVLDDGISHHHAGRKECACYTMIPKGIGISQSSQGSCYLLAWMGLECSDLFERHMQSGHGNVYIDSFALFI